MNMVQVKHLSLEYSAIHYCLAYGYHSCSFALVVVIFANRWLVTMLIRTDIKTVVQPHVNYCAYTISKLFGNQLHQPVIDCKTY